MEKKAQCIGGWAFLLLALGLFLVLPGTILTGIYASDNVVERDAALSIFCIGLLFALIGCVLFVVWCRIDRRDDDKEKLSDEESPKESGSKANGDTAGASDK